MTNVGGARPESGEQNRLREIAYGRGHSPARQAEAQRRLRELAAERAAATALAEAAELEAARLEAARLDAARLAAARLDAGFGADSGLPHAADDGETHGNTGGVIGHWAEGIRRRFAPAARRMGLAAGAVACIGLGVGMGMGVGSGLGPTGASGAGEPQNIGSDTLVAVNTEPRGRMTFVVDASTAATLSQFAAPLPGNADAAKEWMERPQTADDTRIPLSLTDDFGLDPATVHFLASAGGSTGATTSEADALQRDVRNGDFWIATAQTGEYCLIWADRRYLDETLPAPLGGITMNCTDLPSFVAGGLSVGVGDSTMVVEAHWDGLQLTSNIAVPTR